MKGVYKFLSVCQITPNPNTVSSMSPAELMFARKIRSVFDRLLPSPPKKKYLKKDNTSVKIFKPGDKVYF